MRWSIRWWQFFLVAALLGGCVTEATRPAAPQAEAATAAAVAQDDAKPILTLDPGGHMALIRDLMFSPDGREIYSVADDKTIRVWEVASGRPLRTLRGQIGKGSEGKLFAGALAPDGGRLAVGGWLAGDLPNRQAIRLLDPRTGTVERLLKGHNDVVLALAFSPDGRLLASGSADNTARLWEAASGRLLHTLRGHTERISAVAFSPDGKRLTTGSDDHSLRLWSVADGALLAELQGHGDRVRSAAFTPDGRYLLSGSFDKTIRLWDGRSGAFIKELARQEATVDSITIAPDSRWVVTGAGYGTKQHLHRFAIPSGEPLSTFTEHDNVVLATAIAPDGRLVASGGGDDKVIHLWEPASGQVRHTLKGQGQPVWAVGFSADGAGIAWGNAFSQNELVTGRGPLRHTFRLGDLTRGEGLDAPQAARYQRGIARAGAVALRTSGQDPYGSTDSPTLELLRDGQPLHRITRDTTNGQTHMALTLTPDGRLAISGGANGALTVYDTASGAERFALKGHTGDIWAVAPSPDGRLLLSGSADQTVRLWSLEDGTLRLTLFAGRDGEWVAWTPDGFFEASANGAAMVGYHLNRGEGRAADYVQVEQLYSLFHRPDLVRLAASADYRAKADAALARIGHIDQVLAGGLPPELERLGPATARADESGRVTLRLKLRPRDGGLGRVDFRVNGVLLEQVEARAVDLGHPKALERVFTVEPGRSDISATVWNSRGQVESLPLEWVVEAPPRRQQAPRLHVLAVGVNDYRDVALKLRFAAPDAVAIARELEQRGRGLFAEVRVTPLTDRQVTRDALERALTTMAKEMQSQDLFVFYLAGHGEVRDGRYLFLPPDLVWTSEAEMLRGAIDQETFTRLLAQVPAQKSLLLLDTCNGGALGQQVALLRGAEEKTAIDHLIRATGRAVIAASAAQQPALEGYDGHGVFTAALLEGLAGPADSNGNRHLEVTELAAYLVKRVPAMTLERWKYEQFPQYDLHGNGDFPIARVAP